MAGGQTCFARLCGTFRAFRRRVLKLYPSKLNRQRMAIPVNAGTQMEWRWGEFYARSAIPIIRPALRSGSRHSP